MLVAVSLFPFLAGLVVGLFICGLGWARELSLPFWSWELSFSLPPPKQTSYPTLVGLVSIPKLGTKTNKSQEKIHHGQKHKRKPKSPETF